MKSFVIKLVEFVISSFYFWYYPIFAMYLIMIPMGVIMTALAWDTIELNREEFKEWFNENKK